jgi:hypothetical protein
MWALPDRSLSQAAKQVRRCAFDVSQRARLGRLTQRYAHRLNETAWPPHWAPVPCPTRAALANAGAKEPEQAANFGIEALCIGFQTNSTRIFTELTTLDEILAPWNSLQDVARFRDAMRAPVVRSFAGQHGESCSMRKSRPRTCTQLILAAGIRRVVTAWREPSLFVADARGSELLAAAGVTVVELPEFADRAMEPNRHLRLNS